MKTIRVFAVEGRSLPFEGGVGRFVARDKKGEPLEDGEDVPAKAYYHRAIARRDLTTKENES
jgi:hypothetical protein